MIRVGDKEIEYNPDFRFYITTKMSNPHYAPEIAAKAAIVNFAVKEQGKWDSNGVNVCLEICIMKQLFSVCLLVYLSVYLSRHFSFSLEYGAFSNCVASASDISNWFCASKFQFPAPR